MINSTFDPSSFNEFTKANVEFKGQKILGNVLAGQVGNIDLTLTDDMILSLVDIEIEGRERTDTMKLQVLDSNMTVQKELIDWFAKNIHEECKYPIKVLAGSTIRIEYTSTLKIGSSTVKANLSLYKILV